MRLLLIHQNFPGQFRSLTSFLLNHGHELIAICSHERPIQDSIVTYRYPSPTDPPFPMRHGQDLWYHGIQRAEIVARICHRLRCDNWIPDRILGHSGWGETLALNEVFPNVPVILWPELWLTPLHAGYGLDPLLREPGLDEYLDLFARNAMTRLALDYASAWIMPTFHQASSLPKYFQSDRLHIVHEGIDTTLAAPNPHVSFQLRGITIDCSTPTITFVNRNLERLRGFDQFMRCLPYLQTLHPDLRIIIVGDNEKGYGHGHSSGQPLRQVMLDELKDQINLNRIHFLGRIPHYQLIALFQASWLHVYLSYPFVLSWSLLEAMSCGCPIVGSLGLPLSEVIENGVEGILVPMNDSFILASRISSILSNPSLRSQLGHSARLRALSYDISLTLPKIMHIIGNCS